MKQVCSDQGSCQQQNLCVLQPRRGEAMLTRSIAALQTSVGLPRPVALCSLFHEQLLGAVGVLTPRVFRAVDLVAAPHQRPTSFPRSRNAAPV